jgi:hypothetical protein
MGEKMTTLKWQRIQEQRTQEWRTPGVAPIADCNQEEISAENEKRLLKTLSK